MKKNSRTKNSINNLITSTGYEMITYVLKFVNRTVFLNTLGVSYLGISGLFSNILQLLSLAELGFGTSIMYRLYLPLKQQDNDKIAAIMNFFKWVYRGVAAAIFLIGICLMPCLKIFIKDFQTFESLNLNAYVIFGLYLIQTASTYIFSAYKQILLKADQKSYVLNTVNSILAPLNNVILIIVLIVAKDFITYLVITSFLGIGENLVRAYIIDKQYPNIKNKKAQLSSQEKKSIVNDCSAVFIRQINSTVIKTTDNFVISSFIGLGMVGYYSNYYMIYTLLNNIPKKIIASIQASLGNKFIDAQVEEKEEFSSNLNFIIVMLYGIAACGLAVVVNEFISAWVGAEYLISKSFPILIAVELYVCGLKQHLGLIRDSLGLFSQYKFVPLLSAVINVALSVILVKPYGINGVIIGTIAADVCVTMVFFPIVVYKYGFQNKCGLWKYYSLNILYAIEFAVIGYLTNLMCKIVLPNMGWISVFVHAFLCGIVALSLFMLLNMKRVECKETIGMLRRTYNRFLRKKQK